ncbi:MAG: hypothetical protein ACLP1X_30480 [Polyangiaceae bacterium]
MELVEVAVVGRRAREILQQKEVAVEFWSVLPPKENELHEELTKPTHPEPLLFEKNRLDCTGGRVVIFDRPSLRQIIAEEPVQSHEEHPRFQHLIQRRP